MKIDAHHHLWDLTAVHYPWLMATGEKRFFGDPAPIQRDYLISEFRKDAETQGFSGSVHIQVGAENGLAEAEWVEKIALENPDWPMVQVAFCDLTSPNTDDTLNHLKKISTVRGVRQIVGRAPEEDKQTGTNNLLSNPDFKIGLIKAAEIGLSFDLQLIPELMENMAVILRDIPELKVALCHAGSPHDRTQQGLQDWAQKLRHLSALPNVYCKLSGLGMFDHDWTAQTIKPIVDELLLQFGETRVMFGSNFPVDSLYSDYTKITQAYHSLIPDDWHAAIFGGNAALFYEF